MFSVIGQRRIQTATTMETAVAKAAAAQAKIVADQKTTRLYIWDDATETVYDRFGNVNRTQPGQANEYVKKETVWQWLSRLG